MFIDSFRYVVLAGGPLDHHYKLIQFHAHWGRDCSCGSEHVINGNHYSAELHFVHWNSDLYSSPRQAAISKNGLAVVGVFLEAVPEPNRSIPCLETISDYLGSIKYKGSYKQVDSPMNLLELMPKRKSYITYLGSLTTPPLWETVTWIVFEQPIKCSRKQVIPREQCLWS